MHALAKLLAAVEFAGKLATHGPRLLVVSICEGGSHIQALTGQPAVHEHERPL